MPFGLVMSILFHGALLGWALFSMRSVPALTPDTPAISADIITPSEFLRLKRGSEDSKKLETKAKEEPKPDDSKNETKKPNDAPPPPPPPAQEVAKAEPPDAAEPPKPAEPVKPPEPPKKEPDSIAKKIEEPPPPPEPAPGPTPDEKKLLEEKLEQQKAEEAKKKAEEQAKKKAEEEAKKKKLAEDAKKKKKAEEAKKKADAAKHKFDPSKIASILNKSPEDAPQKALIDKDPKKKGQQAAGTSSKTDATGQEAGTKTGADTVLSAREQDLLKGMLKQQLNGCWRPPGTGGGDEVPVVELHWELNADGSLRGEPRVTSAPSTPAGQVYSEAALRAVRSCAPFHLPPDKYEGGWQFIDWTFDPREML